MHPLTACVLASPPKFISLHRDGIVHKRSAPAPPRSSTGPPPPPPLRPSLEKLVGPILWFDGLAINVEAVRLWLVRHSVTIHHVPLADSLPVVRRVRAGACVDRDTGH